MHSSFKSGLLALTLVSGISGAAYSQSKTQEFRDWRLSVSMETLADDSVLTEYYGETIANESEDISFRVGFIPRFGCAPLITFRFAKTADAGLLPSPNAAELETLSVSIDGIVLPFPVVADETDSHYSAYMNASLQRRITSKIRIEVGNDMVLSLAGDQKINFSLLGSTDSITLANQNCRRHDPTLQW